MAQTVQGGGQQRIGRQIVLPFSKAFEIAWKGIRIRIWRSMITMSGIILAIAFLMSVWTGGVFDRSLRSVGEDHPLHSLVQGALEAEAMASGGVRLHCIVAEQRAAGASGQVTPGTSIQTFLNAAEAFRAETVPAEAEALVGILGQEDAGVDALVLVGMPPTLSDPAAAGAVRRFVRGGGFLLVYGAQGIGDGREMPLADIMPAKPTGETLTIAKEELTRGSQAVQVQWRTHPAARFLATQPEAGAVAMAEAGERKVGWSVSRDEGSVAWYPVEASSAADPDVLSWFVRGQTAQETDETVQAANSLMMRLIARGAGGTGEKHDMRGVWLVTLSLMVCVVGITNAMLMSVTERFQEIGTMKCLGALDKFVVKLFLIESSLQGVVGSLAGALIGFVLAFLRALFTYHVKDLETGQSYWLTLQFFPMMSVLAWVVIALVVGIFLSIIAAIYPAIRAARMEPVQAMRVEA